MNRILPCLLAALAVPAALSAASFEGKVSFKITSRGQPQEMNYSIKGDKLRLELPAQAGAGMGGMIIDTTKRETTVIMDAQKMYMVNPIPEAATPRGEKTGDAPTFEKSGEQEKILGYPAEKYISTYQGEKTEMWLAAGLGTFMGPGGGSPMGGRRGGGPRGGGAGGQAWERTLAGKELFPLRVIGHDKAGAETFRMEATAIEKQSLPDALFAPPAGYQKFDMGNMMKGMMPGG